MSQVLYRKEGRIAYISLNNPQSLNAVNRAMVQELAKVWIDFRDDDNVWVAILSGEGKSFCAGADVKDMKRGTWRFRDSLIFGDDRMAPSSYQVWKPIVAAVHRHVYGAGLWLALEADMIVASEDAKFGVPEGMVNVPTLFAAWSNRYFTHAITGELLYTGKPLNAERAYQIGLINQVVPSGQVMAAATSVAEQICANGPLSIWATKEMYRRGCNMHDEEKVALTEHIAVPVFNSEDSIEAKQAFVEKRKPEWKLK